MPILDTTLRRVRRYIGIDISLEGLEEDLFKLGFELESAVKKEDDYELKIEVTPDRPDCLSTIGLARALALYKGIRKPTRYAAQEGEKLEIIVDESVKEIRPYIAAFVASGIRLSEDDILELIWTQEKLHATFCRNRRKASIGFYPLKKISWPLRYYAELPSRIKFAPLGSEKTMTGVEILELHPTGRKYAGLLRGKDRYPLFVDANNNILSMPPIINSREYGEIKVGETDILVETTGVHKETMKQTLNILATMLCDMGAKISSVRITYPQGESEKAPYFDRNTRNLDISYAERVLGVELNKDKIMQLLEKMGYIAKDAGGGVIVVDIPPYRTDIFHEIDIVDDIARAYGFDNFEPELTPVFTVAARLRVEETVDQLREVLIGLGFSELFTFSLTSLEDQFVRMRLNIPPEVVRIAGAKETKINVVRRWLLPEVLKAIAENKACEYPIKVFEISDVAKIYDGLEAKSCNEKHMAIVISDTKANYTQIKSCIDYIFCILGRDIEIVRENHPSFIEGRCAAILVEGAKIGVIGELHPQVLLNFGLTIPTVAAEIDLTKVLGIEVREVEWA